MPSLRCSGPQLHVEPMGSGPKLLFCAGRYQPADLCTSETVRESNKPITL